jgi:hypothetical protein
VARRAAVAARLGHSCSATKYAACAEELRQAFESSFYDEALGTYVLALIVRSDPAGSEVRMLVTPS